MFKHNLFVIVYIFTTVRPLVGTFGNYQTEIQLLLNYGAVWISCKSRNRSQKVVRKHFNQEIMSLLIFFVLETSLNEEVKTATKTSDLTELDWQKGDTVFQLKFR